MPNNKWECAECCERPSEDQCHICNDYICVECGHWLNDRWVCRQCVGQPPEEPEYEHEIQESLDTDFDERVAYIIDESK